MKHGPNALIDENLPVVIIATCDRTIQNPYSGMKDDVERDGSEGALGKVIAIAPEGDEEIAHAADHVIYDSAGTELLLRSSRSCRCSCSPIIGVRRGCDVDQPRNLAKSVTVE